MEAAAWNAAETIITAGQKNLTSDRDGAPFAPLYPKRTKKKNDKNNQNKS
jgi:hypothetical protein